MDGPVLSGGVIVLVAVLLWMLYLLPSWRGRFQYNASERNAVRLNQALRVLAETSETPGEVRFELNARTALAQQKLAKRVQSEREAAELETLREELAATRADPVIRRARSRRRVRVTATSTLVLGLVVAGLGVWQLLATGSSVMLWMGGAAILIAAVALQRMAAVAARVARATHAVTAPVAPRVAPELHDQGRATWTPRPLPEPLVSVAGSRAQAAQAQLEAQEQRRKAARVAALRERAEQMGPEAPVALPAASSPYARMGFVDDAEIEAHVREMLSRRAAG
ncbi:MULTISPECIES: hypothetical protein [unclassified Microbacterium]|uniref:hypothetical protein n=1 Tax=unclassified Microbacterium TaxID=2609290 RepID=UPI000CFD1277|nr:MULTISPECIES: hypothetical protein [unclassified Microbacterium]PQZ56035.1 hypothetical protein CQ032_10620 [Microbacterium sp. MYb43]PQZ78513.1 hypothetical protein CQ031_09950 [Microbacterium sp. MYb40]PRB22621.1 hypothetical protein CQ040_04375 [Microbacterium sp. MYb54]PRB26808.1 hypothetical protein CQ037_12990 [Microbacterium sp. MYb50]PRB68887.1 hypothetical protein CQ021_04540 [Microbacterium sp. MYb24]